MLRYGICGGGSGSFIADVHMRGIAAAGGATLSAGCFSRNPEKNRAAGEEKGISPERIYGDYAQMAKQEAARPDGIDFVVIATPNAFHYEMARAFLEAGIHVSCDKPVAVEEWQARELKELAERKQLKFLVTFTYAGYPALREIRRLVTSGELGEIVMVNAEYAADFMAQPQNAAAWRNDPQVAGKMNATADIGSHAAFLSEFLTGLSITQLCCQMDAVFCRLDTNVSMLLKFDNGASGMIWLSQIAHGNDNGMRIRIYGTKGAVEWRNEEQEVFLLTFANKPTMRISKGQPYEPVAGEEVAFFGRLPSGHPEGVYYCFANLYQPFINAIAHGTDAYYPDIRDGERYLHWMERCYESNQKRTWVAV